MSGKGIDVRMIDRFCKFLNLQPGDLIECVPDPEWYSDQAKKWGADKNFSKKVAKENREEVEPVDE